MQAVVINRDFGELSYYRLGLNDARPVLLGLSGFGCSYYNYIDLLPELIKDFQVVLIDNRGIGKSDKTKFEYTLRDVAMDALAVMDELKIKSFGLMGISMGGFIAQELIALAPERVKGVSFMCTLSSAPDFIHPVNITEDGLRKFNTLDIKMQSEFSTAQTVHPSLKEKKPDQYQRIINLRIENIADLEETIRQNNAAVAFLKRPFDLSVIQCPVLVMSGADDRFVDSRNTEVFKRHISNCKSILIEESDHFFFLEKPKEVALNLVQFFKEVLL
jgi:3-oxoadipate enol-lactonase